MPDFEHDGLGIIYASHQTSTRAALLLVVGPFSESETMRSGHLLKFGRAIMER